MHPFIPSSPNEKTQEREKKKETTEHKKKGGWKERQPCYKMQNLIFDQDDKLERDGEGEKKEKPPHQTKRVRIKEKKWVDDTII